MPAPKLAPELWTKIITHLQKPLPNRKSCMDDRVERIDQGDLARVMRVSKMFNSIAAPLLYTTVVFDDFDALFYHLNHPAAASGIPSKDDLLAMTRKLYFEYPTKLFPATRTKLRQLGFSPFIMSTYPEVSTMIQAAALFCGPQPLDLGKAMPKLTSFASCGLLGQSDQIWMAILGQGVQFPKLLGEIQKAFTRAIMLSGVETFCQSGNFGPICLHPAGIHELPFSYTTTNKLRKPLRFTAHITLENEVENADKLWNSCLAGPVVEAVWCFDNYTINMAGPLRRLVTPDNKVVLVDALQTSYGNSLAGRHESIPAQNKIVRPIKATAFIPLAPQLIRELEATGIVTVPPGSTREAALTLLREHAARNIQKVLRATLLQPHDPEMPDFVKIMHPDDSIEVHTIDKAPACPSCDWLPVKQRKVT